MAELKRSFTAGRMNKDLDERLVPDGHYTDALNIQVTASDGSNVGTVQTLRGNTQHNTMNLTSGYYGVTDNATVVGSIAVPEKDCIYYFIADADSNDIKRDYILEYNCLTERLAYVFVDIFQVNEQAVAASTSSNNFLYIPVLTITDVTSGNQNITGVRIGMLVTGSLGGVVYGASDNIRVSDIIFDSGNNRYKVYLEQDGVSFTPSNGVAENNTIRFIADRVLDFSLVTSSDDTGVTINAINYIDGNLYWTDGYTEPKKINIKISKLGTGGTEYLIGGGIAGYASATPTTTHATFLSDTPFFHTRLVESIGQVTEQGQFIYNVVRKRDQKRAVYVDKSHVTVIRKAPTEPLDLDMFRSQDDRIPNNSTTSNLSFTTVTDTFSAYNTADVAEIWEAGVDEPTVTFDTEVDFRVGDIILFARQQDTDDATTFTDYSIRAEVIASPVTNPNDLYTGPFTIRILSISGNLEPGDLKWYVRLELPDPLFEFKFPRFSYRYRYEGGEYSTFAPWSQIAFLPGKFEYQPKEGYNLGMANGIRKITLKGFVPQEENMPEDVVAVDLLYKETNNPVVYSVKTVKPTDGGSIWPGDENDLDYDDNGRGAYTITTDTIHLALPSEQILRPWDNVPRKAVAQEISASRLVYGNYTSSYTVSKDPVFQVGLNQTSLDSFIDMNGGTGSDFALPSVKSMRTYQIGVVFSDRYGRETPVLTAKGINNDGDESWATVRVSKEAASTRNRIAVKLAGTGETSITDIPSWAEFYSWYIKEPTTEYYNMAMDRWYEAEDGNVWVSFPSSERNKIDEETFLILKKAHGSDEVVQDKARYKVLAIEEEAPDYIKTEDKSYGILANNPSKTSFGNSTRGYPLQDTTFILVDQTDFQGEFGDPMTWMENPDTMSLRLRGADRVSDKYEISKLSIIGDDYYKLKITTKFEEDADFTSTDDTWDNRIDGLSLEIIAQEIVNRPEFDGRFFVKLVRDQVLEQYVMSSMSKTDNENDWAVKASWGLRYLNNNGYQNAYSADVGSASLIPEDAKEWGWGDTDYNQDSGALSQHFQGYSTHAASISKNRTQRSHHTSYWWGDEAQADVPGNDEVEGIEIKNKHVHADPIRSLNDGKFGYPFLSNNTKADEFWLQMAGRQDFFIDACTAYSWNGRPDNRPGGYFGGNLFQSLNNILADTVGGDPPTWNDGNLVGYPLNPALDNYINPQDAGDMEDGAPAWGGINHCTGNMKSNKAMPSRGIWNSGSCMDISWTGMGTGYDLTNWDDITAAGGTPHQLKDVADQGTYAQAALFISTLVTDGTKFRFQRDPDETVYTVSSFRNYPEFGYPEPGQGNAYWKNGTDEQTGAFGIRNWCTHDTPFTTPNNLIPNIPLNWGAKKQYYGHNLRQRWTLMVSPAIGSGVSGYNPVLGTADGSETDVPALHHDGTGTQDVIEILERYIDPREGSHYSSNPAVWETEPKENVDPDIYFEASPKIPLYINKESQENFIQRGDVFRFYDTTGSQATQQLYKVLSWTNDNTIQFTAVGSWPDVVTGTSAAVTNPVIEVTKRDHHTFRMKVEDGTYNVGTSTLKLVGTPYTAPLDLPSAQQQYLDWSNCYAFGNGVESDRIRDDFNAPQIDNGVKASATLTEPVREERKTSGLIWSGLYNDTSNTNNLNQFIDGLKITKDLNPSYGSIQALLNRETRLAIFCEDRVLRAETDRDLLFNADGNPQVVASDAVIGDVVAYQGNFGISTNPESLAVTPYNAYFTDVNRGHVLNLTTEGITSISDLGMTDYFGDTFGVDLSKCIGLYDENKKEYNLTIHKYFFNFSSLVRPTSSTTLAFSENAKGWVSFKSFIPQHGVSLNNKFYTFYNGHLWKHHVTVAEDNSSVDRNNFYGTAYTSTLNVPFNEHPQSVKSFGTINYEGSTAKITNFDTEDAHFAGTTNDNWLTGVYSDNDGIEAGKTVTDGEYFNIEDTVNGWYVESIETNLQTCGVIEFKNKENKYYGQITGEATSLNNLDEREFSVQGLGSAVISHSSPSLGASGTITVANNTSTTYNPDTEADGNTDGAADGVWDSTADNDSWSVNTASFDATVGVSESSQQVDLTISPTTLGGASSPYNITASNFKIGGATESPTNTWTGGNVDIGIAKVVFSDNNDSAGTVNAKVYINTFTPTTLNTMYVDIDESSTPPTTTIDRNVCFRVSHTPTTGSSAAYADVGGTTIAEVVDFDTSSLYRTKHSGVVQSDTTTLIAKYTFTASAGYVYSTMPAVAFNGLTSNTTDENYEGCYSHNIIPTYVSSTSSNISSFIVEISYTPPNNPLLYPDPIIDDFCKQTHGAFINFNLTSTSTNKIASNTVTNVVVPESAPYGGGEIPIEVYGVKDTQYRISVQKKTSLTNATTVASGYYNWPNAGFSTVDVSGEINQLVGTIGSNGRTIHRIKLPEVTADTRYDVYLDATTSTPATLSSSVPTKDGDASITQYGIRTITLAPTTHDATLYGTLPSNITIKRPVKYLDDKYVTAPYYETKVKTGPASSSSTRLILDKTKATTKKSKKIKPGQYVIGDGVAHNTTVSSIRNNIVTLSAAATVSSGTILKFVTANSTVKPFSFAIVENGDGDDLSATAGVILEDQVGGFNNVEQQVNGARTNTSVVLNSTTGILAGMSVSGDGIPENITVASITNATTIVVSQVVTVADDAILRFGGAESTNPNIKIIDIKLTVTGTPTVATITGYLRVNSIENTLTAPIYIDNMITSA